MTLLDLFGRCRCRGWVVAWWVLRRQWFKWIEAPRTTPSLKESATSDTLRSKFVHRINEFTPGGVVLNPTVVVKIAGGRSRRRLRFSGGGRHRWCASGCYWYWNGLVVVLLVLWGANGEIMKSEKRGDYGYVCVCASVPWCCVAR